jgi:hypothetical protein
MGLNIKPKPSQSLARNCGNGEFSRRLWALLRIRFSLTAMGAAELLTDAGEPVNSNYQIAAQYLRVWAALRPKNVQLSKKRQQGRKVYVLVCDPGPQPPSFPMRQAFSGRVSK